MFQRWFHVEFRTHLQTFNQRRYFEIDSICIF